MAYRAGEATQVAVDFATLGVSGGLKIAAKNVSTKAARKAGEKIMEKAPGQIRHHRFPLNGHPGGAETLFPSKGLPAAIHSGSGNIAVLGDKAAHGLRHSTFMAAERIQGLNAALGPARVVSNQSDGGCP